MLLSYEPIVSGNKQLVVRICSRKNAIYNYKHYVTVVTPVCNLAIRRILLHSVAGLFLVVRLSRGGPTDESSSLSPPPERTRAHLGRNLHS